MTKRLFLTTDIGGFAFDEAVCDAERHMMALLLSFPRSSVGMQPEPLRRFVTQSVIDAFPRRPWER